MRGFFSTVATAKNNTAAIAKIKGILWGAIVYLLGFGPPAAHEITIAQILYL